MPLPPHHLCFIKIQNGSAYLVLLAYQVVLEKRPLHGCNSSSMLDFVTSEVHVVKITSSHAQP